MKQITLSLLISILSTVAHANADKQAILTNAEFSQGSDSPAIKVGNLVFISAQGPVAGKNGRPISANSKEQIKQVFDRLRAVARAAGGEMDNIVKLNVYMTNLSDYSFLNQCMHRYFKKPLPARTTIQVLALPDDDKVEMDALMILK